MVFFGFQILYEYCIDFMCMDNEWFLVFVQNFDVCIFGLEGMSMDCWVFYDCCYMLGAIFGFGKKVSEVFEEVWELLEVLDDYDGLVLYFMYIVILMVSLLIDWMGYNLVSIVGQLSGENL